MRILIIGGMGFIGANLCQYFAFGGDTVVAFDNLVRRGSELNIKSLKKIGIEFIHGDTRNPEDLNHLSGKFDVILDTAAQPSACTGYSNPTFDITNNYLGLLNVLEYTRKTNSKLIFWSTNKVYSGEHINTISLQETKTRYTSNVLIAEDTPVDGGSHSIYGLSKLCADLTCQEWSKAFDIPIIINRFSCLAGPGQFGKAEQGWITWFVIAALFNLPIDIYGYKGKQVRDVLFMSDIIRLIDLQIRELPNLRGEVFNVGGGDRINTSLLECISLIEKLAGKNIKKTIHNKIRTADHCVYISDIARVTLFFKWYPTCSMKEGIEDIIRWVKYNQKELKWLYGV